MTPILNGRMAAMLFSPPPCTAGRMCLSVSWRLCSYVCQIHLSTWKCWKTHSSPVFDKSYYKNVLAHTIKNKQTLSPLSKQQSIHFKQACFITIIIKYKPTWSINYQKQTENTLLQHIFQVA